MSEGLALPIRFGPSSSPVGSRTSMTMAQDQVNQARKTQKGGWEERRHERRKEAHIRTALIERNPKSSRESDPHKEGRSPDDWRAVGAALNEIRTPVFRSTEGAGLSQRLGKILLDRECLRLAPRGS
ncbi:hypothetical protein CONPUDRAFT_76271 [Coniophora puteana RWD-64-598 SS2]|uniref:Uncharacterized protein n=1 Tax=Coniophora puteana (strain RWD-64-598) TaxID=741705 RepID=A0A5M3MDE5_CONPW|nr:uncharacterized protein CONPUDRAFT_76271 [Coniophora puteana RWD-64-598 SS2]EIW76645.1 hypothetical protein CONPUDRAFT_76271 [Coniophora puteana RWD-64-598 SS2]